MPEGHTIHRLARDHARDLVGHTIAARTAQERFREGAQRVDGTVITRVEAWGKHLFHVLDSGQRLHVHLGLIGKWFRRAGPTVPELTPTTRLRLEAPEAGIAWDLTGPMTCAVIDPDQHRAVVTKLGPDPLRRNADPERGWHKIRSSTKSIGLLVMEQDVIAGIGNVYRSELLNIVGIDPRRPGNQMTRGEFDDLWAETVRQLRLGMRRNKIVTRSASELTKPIAKLAKAEGLYAYKREHCGRCHTELDVYPIGGRTTWSCPSCQPS